MSDRPPAPQRLPFTIAAGVLFTGILVVAILFINKANSPNTPVAATTPSPTALQAPTTAATPTPTSYIPFADCTKATFGAPLQPLNPPSNVHVYSAAPPMTIDTSKLYEVTITTSRGKIVLCLQPNLAPVTVNNFVTLTRNKFYDGLKFHRVVAGFVIQGGDPKGDGSGGPGYEFKDEPVQQAYVAGALAMANSGPNTNGSQFFICTVDDSASLQPAYNLFGKVASGMSVVLAIQQGDVMTSVTVAQQQ